MDESIICLFSSDVLMWTQWQTGMLLWSGRKPLIQWSLMQSIRKWTQELLWWCLQLASTYTTYSDHRRVRLSWPSASSWNLANLKNVVLLYINTACHNLYCIICVLLCCVSLTENLSLHLYRYTRFLKGFLESGENYFLVGFRVTYYIFTDNEDNVPKVSYSSLLQIKVVLCVGLLHNWIYNH